MQQRFKPFAVIMRIPGHSYQRTYAQFASYGGAVDCARRVAAKLSRHYLLSEPVMEPGISWQTEAVPRHPDGRLPRVVEVCEVDPGLIDASEHMEGE